MTDKHPCCQCKAPAVWFYLPASNRADKDRYFCEECIQRGCSCNVNPDTGIEDRDEEGRLYPCCEYTYNEKGFDHD